MRREGHACRARGIAMDYQRVFHGRDKRVPPSGPDKQVPPLCLLGRLRI